MKIVICTKRDIEGNIALNKIVREIQGHELFIILSDKFTKSERKNTPDFIFYERDLPVEQIYPLLEKVPFPPEEPRYLTFNQIRDRYNIPMEIIENINAPEGEARLKEIGPDIILSARFDFIFRKNIIDIPRVGILNFHPAELPRYRGVFGSFRAMLNNEKQVGCTLHFIDEGIDTGPVIGIKYMPVNYAKSMLWHVIRLYPLGIELFIDLLPGIEKGEPLQAIPQNDAGCQYFTFPTPEEFRQFKDKGLKLIDYDEYLEILSGYSTPAPESDAKQLEALWTEPVTGMEFIYVPRGTFMMGDIFGDGSDEEKPVHEVELDGFYIGKYPVTQGQWKKIMKENPSHFRKGDDYPAESVSWKDVQKYIEHLTEESNGKYRFRLPTEAEWEYAARSLGKKERYAGTNDDPDAVAWYNRNSRSSSHPVGGKKPNPLGLYDMSGNVWEWCYDIYDTEAYKKHQPSNPVCSGEGELRVIRGGGWRRDQSLLRCTVRRGFVYYRRDNAVGFRLAMTPQM